MKIHPVSINDIAKVLGVSASTVSRALKDHPDISSETKELVHEYAQKVNYRPNTLATSLRRQRSNTLGIVIPEIAHHFFSTVISGIEDVAYGNGYRVMICQSNEDALRERMNLQVLIDHRVDGILLSMSKNTLDFSLFRDMAAANYPVVFFDRICNEVETDRVTTNDFEGARLLTNHLIRQGRRKILHLAAPQNLIIGQQRYLGYSRALEENNIERKNELMLMCDTPVLVEKMSDVILSMARRVDTMFAVNDFTAVALMKLLQKNGYRVPDQIAVAGFGNDPIAAVVDPSLTTVEQKGYEIGREAVSLLINRIENPEDVIEFETRTFPATLIIRQSA